MALVNVDAYWVLDWCLFDIINGFIICHDNILINRIAIAYIHVILLYNTCLVSETHWINKKISEINNKINN